jgi:hypothetical protein
MAINNARIQINELETKLKATTFVFRHDPNENHYIVDFRGGEYSMQININTEEGSTDKIVYEMYLLENNKENLRSTPITITSLGYDEANGKRVYTIDCIIKAINEIWLYVKMDCLNLKRQLQNKSKK